MRTQLALGRRRLPVLAHGGAIGGPQRVVAQHAGRLRRAPGAPARSRRPAWPTSRDRPPPAPAPGPRGPRPGRRRGGWRPATGPGTRSSHRRAPARSGPATARPPAVGLAGAARCPRRPPPATPVGTSSPNARRVTASARNARLGPAAGLAPPGRSRGRRRTAPAPGGRSRRHRRPAASAAADAGDRRRHVSGVPGTPRATRRSGRPAGPAAPRPRQRRQPLAHQRRRVAQQPRPPAIGGQAGIEAQHPVRWPPPRWTTSCSWWARRLGSSSDPASRPCWISTSAQAPAAGARLGQRPIARLAGQPPLAHQELPQAILVAVAAGQHHAPAVEEERSFQAAAGGPQPTGGGARHRRASHQANSPGLRLPESGQARGRTLVVDLGGVLQLGRQRVVQILVDVRGQHRRDQSTLCGSTSTTSRTPAASGPRPPPPAPPRPAPPGRCPPARPASGAGPRSTAMGASAGPLTRTAVAAGGARPGGRLAPRPARTSVPSGPLQAQGDQPGERRIAGLLAPRELGPDEALVVVRAAAPPPPGAPGV